MHTDFPVIDLAATGENILRLRRDRGLTVRDLQTFFGFEEPQAIYKWQKGKSLPTVDNLYALSALLGVPMEAILVPVRPKPHLIRTEQQAEACCSVLFRDLVPAVLAAAKFPACLGHFAGEGRSEIGRPKETDQRDSLPRRSGQWPEVISRMET